MAAQLPPGLYLDAFQNHGFSRRPTPQDIGAPPSRTGVPADWRCGLDGTPLPILSQQLLQSLDAQSRSFALDPVTRLEAGVEADPRSVQYTPAGAVATAAGDAGASRSLVVAAPAADAADATTPADDDSFSTRARRLATRVQQGLVEQKRTALVATALVLVTIAVVLLLATSSGRRKGVAKTA